ncbi:non-hydrolyzing UDP-N-acetylglucosamine 2-epimerase [Pelagibius sp.]|uniref:non-hydrolyzing UDP-N-acetylglucosamine 2-epimerase n=1 Tax=Pelagibius sp. TaxID=1931238 RepID=UPI002632AD5D|nr:UDP-N-acetylglucosamine 2-epimerase (non-hydrolyzing) [Pelagibius sp.]
MSAAIKVHLIAAARPNFMKVAPLYHVLKRAPWCDPLLIHTGQHYDHNMSGAFLADLGLPDPDHHLGVGSGSHAEQTAGVMTAYEQVCLSDRPDWTIVVGDVNSTLACSLVAAKLLIPIAHLEAGLRSGDRTMPEEINRIVTDRLADLLWTPSPDGDENLRSEGVAAEKIDRIGNIMIDSFELQRPQIEALAMADGLGLAPGGYSVVTLHRPSNVDQPAVLTTIVEALLAIAQRLPLVFPIHPRSKARLTEFGLFDRLAAHPAVHLTEPQTYNAFMSLVMTARLAITDSGGLQEETTYLGIPCLTLRDNTERPITITQGTNRLVKAGTLAAEVQAILDGRGKSGRRPELWDGRTAERAAESLKRHARIKAQALEGAAP